MTTLFNISGFQDGVHDGLITGAQDDSKINDYWYKRGYDFGVSLYCELEEDQ